MKLLIICSKNGGRFSQNDSFIRTDGIFANERFIPNLKSIFNMYSEFKLKSFFFEKVVQVIELPNAYPILVDDPLEYLPESFESHDLAIVLGVHEDILIELPRLINNSGGKALMVPLESRDWLRKWVRDKTIEECKKYDLQYAFPKPFCALQFGEFNVINEFIDEFKMGRPKLRLYVDYNNMIVKSEVLITTPCGNLFNIQKELEGKRLGKEAKEIVAKYWHSFSCLGDVHIDPELGDTVIHVGGHIHYSSVDDAEIIKVAGDFIE